MVVMGADEQRAEQREKRVRIRLTMGDSNECLSPLLQA